MAEFNLPAKEAEPGICVSDHGEDDMAQAIASPADCWEFVGSRPGSPLPQVRADALALDEAIISACSPGSLLRDNYFACTFVKADAAVLPVSTAMAEKHNDDDGHSSERSDALVLISTDTDATLNHTVHNDLMYDDNDLVYDGDEIDNADLMGCDDGMYCDDDHMHHNDTYHDGLPYDDQVQHGVGVLHHHKEHDQFTMYHNELMERDGRRCIVADETHFGAIMHTDEDRAQCINQSGPPCEIVESTVVPISHHEECGFGLLSGLESSRASLHGIADGDMITPLALAEGSSSSVLLEEDVTDVTSQVLQARDLAHGTANIPNKWQHKGFVSVSWVWTQLIRWQTQLGHVNTAWSVALAAAMMGIFILRRGWQRLQAQNQSLRSQLWAKEKRITQLMFQLMQTKDALTKVRRVPVICVKPSLQIPQDNF